MKFGWFAVALSLASVIAADASAQVPVSSAEGGYSIVFPAKPEQKNTEQPGVKMVTHAVRAGDNVFVLAEGLFDANIPDAGAMMDRDVADYIKAFNGRQTWGGTKDFVTSSGVSLPSRQFTFEAETLSGKGLVVVSGRRDIVIAAEKIRPNGTDEAVEKFLNSFKLEK